MIKLELEGSYYEIGLRIGEKCRNLVSSYYSEECSKDNIDFAHECQRSVKKHCPELRALRCKPVRALALFVYIT